MKLSTKLLLIQGTLILCVLVCGTVGFHQAYSVFQKNLLFLQNRFPSVVFVQELQLATSDFRRFETTHAYSETPSTMSESEKQMRTAQEEVQQHFNVFSEKIQIDNEKQIIQNLKALWNQYLQVNKRIIRLSREGNTSMAVRTLQGESRALFDSFADMLTACAAMEVDLGTLTGLENEQAARSLWTLFLLLCCLILPLSVAMSLLAFRSLARRLGTDPDNFCATAHTLAQGDMSILDAKNNEEQEKFTGAYADMLQMVHGMREQMKGVEALTAQIPGGILCCRLDEQFTIHFVNQGFTDIFGYTLAELQRDFGGQLAAIIHQDDREKIHQEVEGQLQKSDIVELEYRILHKEGHNIWVSERSRRECKANGEELLHGVLLDITELKDTRQLAKTQEDRCRNALCATQDFVFECDLLHTFILRKGEDAWVKLLGSLPLSYTDAYHSLLSLCHTDDSHIFTQILEIKRLQRAITDGAHSLGVDFRLRNIASGQYIWFKLTVLPYCNVRGQVQRLLCCISDITARKKQEEKVQATAQLDKLTTLFNKNHAEKEAVAFLSGAGTAGKHALLLIDVDNFQNINDNLGNFFGDAVLADLASTLKKKIRTSDILGRVGGDEFVILLKDLESEAQVNQKAQEISLAMQRGFSGEDCQYEISGSIGIALYPRDGVNYYALFQRAGTALYAAKGSGKNHYCFYGESPEATLNDEDSSQMPKLTALTPSGRAESVDHDLLSYVFEMLYQSPDFGSAVNIILGMIGRYYNVSRAYVFQNSPDGLFCSNTYEWCSERVQAQKDTLQNVPYAETGDYLSRYDASGTFYCEDISLLHPTLYELLERQNIKSMLHVAIRNGEKFFGYVGFDECEGIRRWSNDELGTLALLAKILGVFLVRRDMTLQLSHVCQNTQNVLDAMDIRAYVIDRKSHTILYANAKSRAQYTELSPGSKCHDTFCADLQSPCESCLMQKITDAQPSCTIEMYKARFNTRVLVTAMRMPWVQSDDSVLFFCIDLPEKSPQ